MLYFIASQNKDDELKQFEEEDSPASWSIKTAIYLCLFERFSSDAIKNSTPHLPQ